MKFTVDFQSMINSAGIAQNRHYVRILIVLFGLLLNSYPSIIYAIENRTNTERIFQSFYAVSAEFLNIGDFIWIALQRKLFRTIWQEVLNDLKQKKASNSEKLFEKYENRFNYLFSVFVNLLRVNSLIIVMIPVFMTMYRYWTYDVMVAEDWQMAVPVSWPFAVDNWYGYSLAIAAAIAGLVAICVARPCVQGIYYRVGFHFVSSFQYMQQSFGRLDQAMSYQDYRMELKIIVSYHGQILRLFNEFAEIITGVIFIEYIAMASIACVIGVFFLTSGLNHNISLSANYVLLGSNAVCTMFITSYMGAEIAYEADEIPIAIYNSKWYQRPARQQYEVLMMLREAQRPHILTGLKMFPCNYATFKDVMNTILSVILILREFQ